MKEIFDFLRDLRDNNNREWFNANKERYNVCHKRIEDFTGNLIDKLALFDKDIKGVEPKDCMFRIYRDVRFSPDKSPYKTHFGTYIAAGGGRKSRKAGYYVHIQPDESFLSGGIYCPEPALLKRLRQDIYENTDEFVSIIRDKEFIKDFPEMFGEKLKKVPAPFPADFPEAELLKYKHYSPEGRKPESFFTTGDVVAKTAKAFEKLYPLTRFLNYTVDEVMQNMR